MVFIPFTFILKSLQNRVVPLHLLVFMLASQFGILDWVILLTTLCHILFQINVFSCMVIIPFHFVIHVF